MDVQGCYDKQQGAPASMRLPKNFQPVGTSKKGKLCAAATRSNAPLVGIERATPCGPARQLNPGLICRRKRSQLMLSTDKRTLLNKLLIAKHVDGVLHLCYALPTAYCRLQL